MGTKSVKFLLSEVEANFLTEFNKNFNKTRYTRITTVFEGFYVIGSVKTNAANIFRAKSLIASMLACCDASLFERLQRSYAILMGK
jgi:hypothetical protein